MVRFRLRTGLLIVCWLSMGEIATAEEPSFDCDKARLPDEIAICRVPRLAELDSLVAAGYAYLKSTRGLAFADELGIPLWRSRQACQSDVQCIARRQIESIEAYQEAGAPISLPGWVKSGRSDTNGNSGSTSVAVENEGGTFLVPVLINDQLTLKFVIDSGASDVSIPADVVLTLMRTGTLTKDEFLGSQTYRLADGSTAPSQTFLIRSLKVGDRVLENVKGTIAPVEGSLLLGQSFLSRFRSWSFDNRRGVLILN
jgi:uncharacterized protein